MNAPRQESFAIADILVEPQLNLILRGGQAVQVERQVMLVLLYLVDRAGEVVTRTDILEQLWPATSTNDEALTQAISKLRKAIGDGEPTRRHIQTIRKVGYRLVTPPVEVPGPAAAKGAQPDRGPSSKPKRSKTRRSWVAILVMVFLTGINMVTLLASSASGVVRLRAVNPGVDTTEIDLGSIASHRRNELRLNLDSAQVVQVVDLLQSSLKSSAASE